MSGHSHWDNIKHKKNRKDSRRGKLFSKLAKRITAAAREGRGDPEFNPTLRSAIEEAKEANMPNENIEKAVERGISGGTSGSTAQVVEGYGPAGVAFLLSVETDNRNRTVSELRQIFENNGGSLADAGATSYIFEKGEVQFEVDPGEDRDTVNQLIAALENCSDVEKILTNCKPS
ncbi:MAG: YebC/PmpR family DNA-binding transcriptional regulator [Patescibacteria group bacterium]